MKNKKLTIFDAGIAFLMSFILAQFTGAIGAICVAWIMQICGKSDAQITAFFNTAPGYLVQALFMDIAFVAIFIWYYKRISKQHLLTKPNKSTYKYFAICAIFGVASMFLLSGTLNYFQLFLTKLHHTPSELPYQLTSPSSYIISLISLAVLPAICEELLFRGVIVNALKDKGKIFAIVLSSIMFSIFHLSPSQLIYPVCFGLILATVYLRTNNIIFPILLHFINNALSISIQYFSSSNAEPFTHSTFALIYAIITLWIWISCMRKLFADFKSHSLNSAEQHSNTENPEQTDIVEDKNVQSKNLTATYSDKTNNMVLYGSIAIMLCLYIMMLFI